MSKPPTVSVQIGSTFRQFKPDNPDLLAFIAKQMITTVQNNAVSSIYSDAIPRINKSVSEAVDKQTAKFLPFVAKNMIGIPSPRSATEMLRIDVQKLDEDQRIFGLRRMPFDRDQAGGMTAVTSPPATVWQALSLTWRQKKKANKNRFFMHTGQLRRLLLNQKSGAKAVAQLGGAKIEFVTKDVGGPRGKLDTDVARREALPPGRKGGGAVRILDIKISYAKGLTAYNTPGLGTTNAGRNQAIERKLGFSSTTLSKLAGPEGRHRPLLQPALRYWFFFKMPRVISSAFAVAMNEALRNRKGLG